MGALKDLYQSIWEELGGIRAVSGSSDVPFTEKLRKETVRHFICQELFKLELLLLLNPKQKGALDLSQEGDEGFPFDELELIVKNNVDASAHIRAIKECISDLDDLSNDEDEKQSKELHKDEFSQKVLNLLRNQTAQVFLLSDGEKDGEAELFLSQPKEFVRSVMREKEKNADAFDDVRFEKDLSKLDVDCSAYLRKSHPTSKWNSFREEDEYFNKDALKLIKDIRKWEAEAVGADEKDREKLERKKAKAEKILAKAAEARNSAIRDAFRTGDISEYYYKQRSEQLERRDFSRVPEMFETDALKDQAQYLKNHDLQDLSKSEGDAICKLALMRAQKDKENYLKKEFLSKKGLSHSRRYLISEMAINKELFYRRIAGGNELFDELEEEKDECKISVNIDEIGEDYIGMTMRQVPSPDEKVRSVKK